MIKKTKWNSQKKVDCKLASTYGWKSRFSLEKGFKLTYEDFLNKY